MDDRGRIDIRTVILLRMKQLDWTPYRLAKELKGGVPQATIYGFLRGDFPTNTDHLGRIMDAIGLVIGPASSQDTEQFTKNKAEHKAARKTAKGRK